MTKLPNELQANIYPEVVPFYDEDTNTFSYVVYKQGDSRCAVVDSVLDLDYPSGTVSTGGADRIIDYIQKHQLKVEWILETHVHADHLSAASLIQDRLGGKLAIGANIKTVQETFGKVFNEGTEFKRDGSQFDCLLEDGDTLK
ncbi:MAG: hypothetical protein RI942_1905, partial [Pseudomonadota bacterium]